MAQEVYISAKFL